MNKFTKFILSTIIIGFLSISVLTKGSYALDVPSVPNVPDKPHPESPPDVPDKPHPDDPPVVPTIPGVPSQNGGNGTTPTPTTKPADHDNGNGNGGNGGDSGIGGTSNDGGSGSDSGGQGGAEVLGLSKTSGDLKDEMILMTFGLIIASFGFKGLVSKKI